MMGLWRSREIKPDDRRLPSATTIGREIDDTGVGQTGLKKMMMMMDWGLWRSREIKPDDRRLPSATTIDRGIEDTGVVGEVKDEDLTKFSPKLGATFSLGFICIKMIFTDKKVVVAILFITIVQCLTVFVFWTRSGAGTLFSPRLRRCSSHWRLLWNIHGGGGSPDG